MRLRLESKIAKLLTFAVMVLLLSPYCVVAWSRYRAARVAEHEDRDSLERALQLQPGDAKYQERLARYLLFVDQDAQGALVHYQMAAAMNPYSASSWLGVAQSQLINGNTNSALNAIDHALEVDPHTPSVAWEAGNLLITLGQVPRAMQQFRYTMANDPTMVAQALQLIRRMQSPAEASKIALPADPAIYTSFINMLLLQGNDLEGAKQVWPQLIALNKPFAPQLAFYYVDALMKTGDLEGALQAWSDLEKVSPDVARLHKGANLMHNGSFEFPPLNGGLDWMFPGGSQRDPILQTDVSDAHDGHRSLMVTFEGTRPNEVGIRQYLILEPGAHYRFHGFIKANLQTANGLFFLIIDANNGKRVYQSDDFIDGNKWQEVNGDFRIGPDKHVYLFLVERTANTLIRGSAWIDELQLVKESD